MATVFQKLNLKDEADIVVLDAPKSFEPELKGLDHVRVARTVKKGTLPAFAVAFVRRQSDIEGVAAAFATGDGDIKLWLAYPKQSSRRYTCDFNRDTGWAPLGAAGFEPVRQVAIDEDWSALRFRRVQFIKSLTRPAAAAMSAEGRRRARRQG